MPDHQITKYKRMTDEERLKIQECLDHDVSFKDIAKRIGKDPATVSKEVKEHMKDRIGSIKSIDKDGNPINKGTCPSLVRAPFVCIVVPLSRQNF